MEKHALTGVTVLEIGDELSQYGGKLLADLGATVIKIEPLEGAKSRKVGPFYKDMPDVDNSLYFWHYNNSKKSITVDIHSLEGRQQLLRLLTNIDILIEDQPAGLMQSIGLDYDTLSQLYPHLIYCSTTPFGQEGPWSQYESSDLVNLALSGIMQVSGYDDVPNAPPIAPTGGQTGHVAGYFTAISVVGALLHRDLTGEGQYVDIAAHDCLTVSTEMSIPFWEYQQNLVYRQTGRHAFPNPSTRWNFECKDGRYVLCLNTYLNAKKWGELVHWLQSFDMAEDLGRPEYEDNNYRAERMGHIGEVLGKFCITQDAEYLFRYAQGIQLPWAVVRVPEEMLEDVHLAEDRQAFVQVDHPELGETFVYPGALYQFGETPSKKPQRAPLLGEHNDELLS